MRLIRLAEFKRMFGRYGAVVVYGGKHPRLEREVHGTVYVYPFATKGGRHVLEIYVKQARRALKLMPEDGISDEEWNAH